MSTPAIQALKKQNIAHTVHQYAHAPEAESYAQEAADKLGLAPAMVFKTLVIELDTQKLAVAILPASSQLSMKKAATALKAKKATMATPLDVQRSTGYVLGGVSPLGQKKKLPTVIDQSAEALALMYISAGRRGMEVALQPQDLARLCMAGFADICQDKD